MRTHQTPDGIPVLSRGRHRNPRKGACFMELASVLAGEPWTDHPQCTHPLLGQLARMVNDRTNDEHRSALAVHIPSIVGLRGTDDVRWVLGLTAAVAVQASYEAPEPTQRALAAGMLRAVQLTERLGPPAIPGTEGLTAALERIPSAHRWALDFVGDRPIKERRYVRHSAPAIIKCAVEGAASAAAPDPDGRLRALLEVGIDTARRLEGTTLRFEVVARDTRTPFRARVG